MNELAATPSKSLGLLQVALDAVTEAMLIADPAGRVRWSNQAAADLWGNGLAVLLVSKPLAALVNNLHNIDGELIELQSAEHPLQRLGKGDGEGIFRLETRLMQLQWRTLTEVEEGFLLFVARDQGPIEKALMQQRQFSNQLAHELQTPLAILTGSLRKLQRKAELSEQLQQLLQQSMEETSRLVRLIGALLNLTELDNGLRRLKLQPLALRPWLEQWIADQEMPRKASLKMRKRGPLPGQTLVALDPLGLREVLQQLLDNSLRYSDPPVRIRLELQVQGSRLILLWMDWGYGINPLHQTKIFENFVRLEQHRRPKQADGAGLGLAICRSLMQAMAGTIKLVNDPAVKSDPPSSVFSLSWPLLPAHDF
jgi:signal transduction histidine kinase